LHYHKSIEIDSDQPKYCKGVVITLNLNSITKEGNKPKSLLGMGGCLPLLMIWQSLNDLIEDINDIE